MKNIIIITGPSGSGKSIVINEIMKKWNSKYNFNFSVSYTTRKKRKGEINGKNYFFISKKEFLKWIKEGKFVEYVKFADNYYGTSAETLENNIKNNNRIILDIELEGAKKIINQFKDNTLSIFIGVDSINVLISRLKNRNTEKNIVINKRISIAKSQLKESHTFDYVVINKENNLNDTMNQINNIFMSQLQI